MTHHDQKPHKNNDKSDLKLHEQVIGGHSFFKKLLLRKWDNFVVHEDITQNLIITVREIYSNTSEGPSAFHQGITGAFRFHC